MKVTNLQAFGLEWAQMASGLPMWYGLYDPFEEIDDNDKARAVRLASTPAGTGHDNFLVGITVHMEVMASVKWWQQFQRYHFADIVSSQSTMHRLPDMLKNDRVCFNRNTNPIIVNMLKDMARNGASLEELVYSCPMGLEMTAAVTTNYRQLKTIYQQRKNHKLDEWKNFCQIMADGLPCSYLFTGADKP